MPEMTAHRRGQGAGRGWLPEWASPHQYGPHDEEFNRGRTMTIWAGRKASDGTRDVPVPAAILKQWRQMNTIAHEQARARAKREDEQRDAD